MRLSELKPGTAIQCRTEDEAKALLAVLKREGYSWSADREEIDLDDPCWAGPKSVYILRKSKSITWAWADDFSRDGSSIFLFSELDMPEEDKRAWGAEADWADKSVLVIDTPLSCAGCPISAWNYPAGCFSCEAVERDAPRAMHVRPEWCPLRPLPKKDDGCNPDCDEFADGWTDGWNACLREITGEKFSWEESAEEELEETGEEK